MATLFDDLDKDVCFYCGGLVTKDCQQDHFPLPKNVGGELTVPCCISCHDMKDRYPLEKWPIEWVEKIIQDFPQLNRETKLFLAKAMRIAAEAMKRSKPSQSTGAVDEQD